MVRCPLQRRCRGLVLSVVLLSLSCAKDHPAQLAVVVGTDLAVPGEVDTVKVVVRADDASGKTLYEAQAALLPDRPLTFALTARENKARRVHVSVEGLRAGQRVVRRLAQVSVVRERALRLDMHLLRDCAAPARDGTQDRAQYQQCEANGLTCGEAGKCEPVERAKLPDWRGEEPAAIEPPPAALDGGSSDNSDDAGSAQTGEVDAEVSAPDASVDAAANTSNAKDIVKLALGATHSCALFASGRVLCWGSNEHGELGRDKGTGCPREPESACEPGEPEGIDDAIDISAGEHFTCAVLRDGTVRCFGRTDSGQSGYNGELPPLGPITITEPSGDVLTGVSEVEAGKAFACARVQKEVFCWGDNSRVQIAEIGFPNTPHARPIEGVEAQSLSAGHEFMCAVTAGGPRCWGDNAMRQLASDAFELASPQRIWDVVADEVAGGAEHTCVRVRGDVYCVGRADHGRLGVGNLDEGLPNCGDDQFPIACSQEFLRARMDSKALSVAVGRDFACSRLDNAEGNVACWGWGLVPGGVLGGSVHEPTIVRLLRDVRLVGAGLGHACVVAEERLWCWGANKRGQLGLPAEDGDSITPKEIALPVVD
jgi:alpha-tubulin suppressor-like RCC1 family protein